MSEAAQNLSVGNTTTREELDVLFLEIIEQLGEDAVGGASHCTQAVFELSAKYMDKPAFDTLRKFYDLYFDRGELEKKKDEVNSAVTDMVEFLQEKLAAGEDISESTEFEESEEIKRQRLSLSAVQKQLEGIIVLDAGIKEEILPALSSMQFEDAVRQRMQHAVAAWWKVVEILPMEYSGEELIDLARTIGNTMTSMEEIRDFYQIVLKEQPPEGNDHRSVFIEF